MSLSNYFYQTFIRSQHTISQNINRPRSPVQRMDYSCRGESHVNSLPLTSLTLLFKTPVSMTSVFMHHNETIFPNSYEFVPERWMDLEQRKHLEKYMVAFTKGSRQCIGMKYAPFPLLPSFLLGELLTLVRQSRPIRDATVPIQGLP